MYSFRIEFINVTCPIYKIYAFECCCNLFIEIEIAVEMPNTTIKAWFGKYTPCVPKFTYNSVIIMNFIVSDQRSNKFLRFNFLD